MRLDQVTTLICWHSHTNYSFRTYAFPNTLRIRARKRVVLRNSLPTQHPYSWTMTERKFPTRKIYFRFFEGLEIISKSGHKWLTPNDLIEFSGFSGKPIDILDYQDVEQQGLSTKSYRHFELYLVCSPDLYSWFYFCRSKYCQTSRMARRLLDHTNPGFAISASINNELG